MRRSIGVAGIGLLTIALVAGCGGSDDGGLSKSEFVSKANAICKKGNDEIEAAANEQFGSSGKEPSEQQITQFATETAIPNTQSQIDQIKALDPPSDDEDQVNAILDSAQADVEKVKADPSLLANEGNDPFADTDKLAKEYGMTVCASDN